MSSTKSLPSPEMIEEREQSNRPPAEKAAAVLALLDEQTLTSLQGKVAERHRDKLLDIARSMRSITKPEIKLIAKEFAEKLGREKDAVRGSDDIAERLQSTLFKIEEEETEGDGASALPELPELDMDMEFPDFDPVGLDEPQSLWEKVAALPLKKLVEYFDEKSPSVFALALQKLPVDIASELSSQLDQALLRESFSLTATGGKPNPLALEALDKMIEEDLFAPKPPGAADDDEEGNPNADLIAGILNRLTTKRREMVLDALGNALEGNDLADIASKVLSFEALEYRLPRNAIPVIFREIDEPTILMALKCSMDQKNPVADYLLGNISQRLATGFREKIDAMPAIEEEEGEKAQSNVICAVLEIVEQGRIELLEAEQQPTE